MSESRHSPLLHAFLAVQERMRAIIYRRVGCRATTADLTQDAFLKLWERRSLLTGVADLAGYLVTTGRNLAADHERRRRIAPFLHGIEGLERIADPAPSAEDVVMGRDDLRRLQAAIDSLPPKCRQVFLLSRLEGLTYAEIGARLNISPKTVFSHMVTALERLKAEMART
ncbi:fec I (plasmid) [Shinella sp. HZN7]|jgi:RNA polymerase sigma factor (sigma-70 family)|nr:fec I [Shinella sp. HZN7]